MPGMPGSEIISLATLIPASAAGSRTPRGDDLRQHVLHNVGHQ